jgi:hypothetical protein
MSSTAKSVYYFGIYLLLAGLALFLLPNLVLGVLGIAGTTEIWIRLAGSLAFILGVFFIYMAGRDSRPFFYISMFGRGIFILSVLVLVAFYNAPPALLLFAGVDLLGLLWTLVAYRREA